MLSDERLKELREMISLDFMTEDPSSGREVMSQDGDDLLSLIDDALKPANDDIEWLKDLLEFPDKGDKAISTYDGFRHAIESGIKAIEQTLVKPTDDDVKFADIALAEICPKCDNHLTLMGSIRFSDNSRWLVKRCLSCGAFPVEEVYQLQAYKESEE